MSVIDKSNAHALCAPWTSTTTATMLLSHVQRLPWPLTCLLLATVATASISPSNSSTAGARFQGTLPLRRADADQAQIAELVPLTREAAQRTVGHTADVMPCHSG
jgi:hypothetical protein